MRSSGGCRCISCNLLHVLNCSREINSRFRKFFKWTPELDVMSMKIDALALYFPWIFKAKSTENQYWLIGAKSVRLNKSIGQDTVPYKIFRLPWSIVNFYKLRTYKLMFHIAFFFFFFFFAYWNHFPTFSLYFVVRVLRERVRYNTTRKNGRIRVSKFTIF